MDRFNYSTVNVRSHVGALPDHWLLDWHVLVDCPCSLNPTLHEYVAVEPKVVPAKSTFPFVGLSRFRQSTAAVEETMKSLQNIGTLVSSHADLRASAGTMLVELKTRYVQRFATSNLR